MACICFFQPGKGKTKKFIDKKNSVTFYLAHRSQKDPLIVDETAPQRVLVPLDQAGGSRSHAGAPGPPKGGEKDMVSLLLNCDKYSDNFNLSCIISCVPIVVS